MFINFIKDHLWTVKIFSGIIFLIFLNLTLTFYYKYSKKKSLEDDLKNKTKKIEVFLTPIKLFIYLIVFSYVLNVLFNQFNLSKLSNGNIKIRNILITLIVTWIAFRYKNFLMKKFEKKFQHKIDGSSIEFISKILSILLFFISLLIILELIGLNIMPLVAFGGIGAAAIAFAAKDMIANFFGGLMIYINRPFKINEIIEIPKENIKGHIEHIGWYSTLIREVNKEAIYIPNSTFSTFTIKNRSRRTHRRIELDIPIRHIDFLKIEKVILEIRNFLKDNQNIDVNLDQLVYISKIDGYFLNLNIKVYTKITDSKNFGQLNQDVILEIEKLLNENSIEIAYPISYVNLENKN
jgi:MscS family membrane protein